MKKVLEMFFYFLLLVLEIYFRERVNRVMFFYSDLVEVIIWDCEVWFLMLVLSFVGGYVRVSEFGFGFGRVIILWNLFEKESRFF